jgi:hypothetical protein
MADLSTILHEPHAAMAKPISPAADEMADLVDINVACVLLSTISNQQSAISNQQSAMPLHAPSPF